MHKIRAHNKKTSKYLAHNAAECDQSAGKKKTKKIKRHGQTIKRHLLYFPAPPFHPLAAHFSSLQCSAAI